LSFPVAQAEANGEGILPLMRGLPKLFLVLCDKKTGNHKKTIDAWRYAGN
jgi:hypothetical protein